MNQRAFIALPLGARPGAASGSDASRRTLRCPRWGKTCAVVGSLVPTVGGAPGPGISRKRWTGVPCGRVFAPDPAQLPRHRSEPSEARVPKGTRAPDRDRVLKKGVGLVLGRPVVDPLEDVPHVLERDPLLLGDLPDVEADGLAALVQPLLASALLDVLGEGLQYDTLDERFSIHGYTIVRIVLKKMWAIPCACIDTAAFYQILRLRAGRAVRRAPAAFLA